MPYIGAAVVTLFAAVAMAPRLIHALDGGHAEVTVSQFATPGYSPESRNVTVSNGEFLLDQSIEIATKEGTSTAREYAIPLVAQGWKPGSPVRLVLKTPELTEAEFDTLDPAGGIEGVLRTVWWEGLQADEKRFFTNEHKLKLDDAVAELEYRADPGADLTAALSVIGVVFVVSLGVAVYLSRRRTS